ERDALGRAHAALRAEAAAANSQLGNGMDSLNKARGTLGGMRVRQSELERERLAERREWDDRLQVLSFSLERGRARLHAGELAAGNARAESLEERGALAEARSALAAFENQA
ncbi:unnamed protein product, partial [Prorocentrum cordatum]